MPVFKGNLHAHTTFSDGRRPIDEVIARYRELDYDFLAITDHEDRIFDDYWFNIPAGDDRMLVLPGVELNYEPLSQHVGKVSGDRETLYILNHPARYALTVDETLYRIRAIREAGLPIEAIEITDTGVYRPEYDVEALTLPKVATDDSHRDSDFGRAWIEVEAATKTADAILGAVKAGDFRMGFATTKRPLRCRLPTQRSSEST